MKWPILRILWGLLLILAGVLFLLNSIGTISIGEYQWAILLGIGGLAFLSVFISDRNQ
jgi:drug/metabolite transporter (DMT)-like permease